MGNGRSWSWKPATRHPRGREDGAQGSCRDAYAPVTPSSARPPFSSRPVRVRAPLLQGERTMRWCTSLAALLGLLAPLTVSTPLKDDDARQAAIEAEMKSLKGTWSAPSFYENGKYK